MKIAGVHGATTKGVQRGTPIELDPKGKTECLVKETISKQAPEGFHCYCDAVTVDGVSAQSLGPRKDGKTFANNSYQANGTVVVRSLKIATDKLYPADPKKFKIQFEDVLDGWGMPDLKVSTFELE